MSGACRTQLAQPSALSFRHRLLLWAAPPLASGLLRIIGTTLHIEEEGNKELYPEKKSRNGRIYAAWHSRLLLGMYAYRNHGINVLVSQSRDGELLARALSRFGFTATRGSTSRGAIGSLKHLAEILAEGKNVMIAPDGPRGPREQAQLGVIQLAYLTGAPIIPWTWSGDRMIRLNSWDRLRVPLPFGQCKFWTGNPIEVVRKSSREDLELRRKTLEAELQRLAAEEEAAFPGSNVDP